MKKLLLVILLHPYSFGACSSAWNPLNWFKKPTISRDYTKADYDQNPQSQKIVFKSQNQELIVIEEGRLFRKSKNTKFEWSYIKNISKVKAILLYKNTLVALRNNGDIFLLTEQERQQGEWLKIGDSARKILATSQDLFALIKDQLWIYKGAPGEEIITYVQIPIVNYVNNIPITTFITTPMSEGREVAFQKSSIEGLTDIVLDQKNQDVSLVFENGTKANYYKSSTHTEVNP